jgi:hypothetical protein
MVIVLDCVCSYCGYKFEMPSEAARNRFNCPKCGFVVNSPPQPVQKSLVLPTSPPYTMPVAAEAPLPTAELLVFEPGAFLCRGHRERLVGEPLQVLKALSGASGKTLTLDALQRSVWPEAVTGQETVRSAVSKARKALSRAYKICRVRKPRNAERTWPVSLVERGQGLTAWRLDLP